MNKQEIIQKLTEAKGNRWTKAGKDRFYFDPRNALDELETERYGSGNISSAALDGKAISNSEAKRLIGAALDTKLWYDLEDGKFHWYRISYQPFEDMLRAYVSELKNLIS